MENYEQTLIDRILYVDGIVSQYEHKLGSIAGQLVRNPSLREHGLADEYNSSRDRLDRLLKRRNRLIFLLDETFPSTETAIGELFRRTVGIMSNLSISNYRELPSHIDYIRSCLGEPVPFEVIQDAFEFLGMYSTDDMDVIDEWDPKYKLS